MRFGVLVFVSLVFCSCTNKEKVSFETAEEARKVARENSGVLARQFRAEMKMDDYDLMLRGDSTITVDCPQGDGWASIDMLNKKTGETVKLKCSTVSAGIGCILDSDFKQRAQYANKEGNCDKDVPHPLPKIMN